MRTEPMTRLMCVEAEMERRLGGLPMWVRPQVAAVRNEAESREEWRVTFRWPIPGRPAWEDGTEIVEVDVWLSDAEIRPTSAEEKAERIVARCRDALTVAPRDSVPSV